MVLIQRRYYQPWLETFMITELEQAPVLPPPDSHRPRSSQDKPLTAFAQLGCLRLNAKRGIVTLLDKTKQYILAEATKSLSLLTDSQHVPGDELWFGNSFIERGKGVSEDAMYPATYTAHSPDGSSYAAPALVVDDLALHDFYKTRNFAGHGVSFYCGVPITTKLGHVIGVYSVTDDKPRNGLSPDELRFLVDMSVIVVQHLESVKIDRAKARGDRLIHGIGTFFEGNNAEDEASGDLSLPHHSSPYLVSSRANNIQGPSDPSGPPANPKHVEFKGMVIEDANASSRESRRLASEQRDQAREDHLSRNAANGLGLAKNEASTGAQEDGSSSLTEHSLALTQTLPLRRREALMNSQQVFARAATILRHCLRADGVVFLDASAANLGYGSSMKTSEAGVTTIQHTKVRSRRYMDHKDASKIQIAPTSAQDEGASFTSQDSSSSSSSTAAGRSHSDSSTARIKRQHCGTLGVSLPGSHKAIKIPERTLRRFVRRHPHGKCFIFDEFGKPASSDESSESASTVLDSASNPDTPHPSRAARDIPTTNALVRSLRGARNIVFVPLWDSAHERWHAGLVAWSNDLARLANVQDDMSYLKAFNNAVMNEVHRINLALSDTAKATFLANISHELRSPLHGILGSIEFLHDTSLDDFQASMVISVETCGKTLLDTVNHVLDYSKINNLSRQGGNPAIESASGSLTQDFDLAQIVEEAVEAVYAGQVFQLADTNALEGRGPSKSAANRATQHRQSVKDNFFRNSTANPSQVRLTLNIDDYKNWRVRSQPGAVRRVVMNILGNALKYTQKGNINVELVVDPSRKKSLSNLQVLFKVTDTGRGMSDEFMQNHAFTAFSQEDSLATGTGLGLSIVRQIVDSLGGKIDLSSEKDIGTEIKIWLSLPRSTKDTAPDFDRSIMTETLERTKGLEMCLLASERTKASVASDAIRSIQSVENSMRSLVSEWFNMTVSSATSMKGITANFFLCLEPPPVEYLMEHHGRPGVSREIPVIILCTNAFEALNLRNQGIHRLTEIGRIIEVVSQPCGPHKMAKVLHRCMQRMKMLKKTPTRWASEHVPASLRSGSSSDLATEAPVDAATTQGGISGSRGHEDGAVMQDVANEKTGSRPQPENARPRVLVVDDNHINLHLLVTFVRRTNYPHESAVDGAKAVAAYRRSVLEDGGKNAFQYILMDISMPVMNGNTAAREIRQFEKENQVEKPATIIALTGLGSESAQTEAYQAGFDHFLSKPIVCSSPNGLPL